MAPKRRMRPRSPVDVADDVPKKRQRRSVAETKNATVNANDGHGALLPFASGLLGETTTRLLADQYRASQPFKHVVIDKLFQESLLMSVKDEIVEHLSFTEKETDIYKVLQTGDLASLSYLSEEQRLLFPSLQTLRDSLYSKEFRTFIRKVTGCGPLSSRKDRQDMSVNTYKKSCHLLNHDDVIGSRRVSYILYMPLPINKTWQSDWGGALELYPVVPGSNPPEPEARPSKTIPPSWGQFVMFEVQPGKSFHSVEEVVVDTDESGRQRLSISGWFHRAQPGEEDYEENEMDSDSFSSRNQLISHSSLAHDYAETDRPFMPTDTLTPDQITFLTNFLDPVYLTPKAIEALTERFATESSLELHRFLKEDLAEKLETGLAQRDVEDGLGVRRVRPIPPHSSGTSLQWHVKGPPHKARYCVLSDKRPSGRQNSPSYVSEDSPEWIMRRLQEELFPSPAFRTWLASITSLVPLRHSVQARRFRPGLDYTLATSEEKETRLDVCLALTPPVDESESGKYSPSGSWSTGEWGGWECYLAPPDMEDDPAVYRSSNARKVDENGKADKPNGRPSANGSNGLGPGRVTEAAPADQDEEMSSSSGSSDDSEDDNAPLLTVQPGFNRLLLVLRDEKVMHFVKYLSASAPSCRWDVYGEWEVGMVQENETESE